MTQQQMVAMIRTLLYFMGKQNYMPTSAAVTPILLEALSARALVPPLAWDVASYKAGGGAPPAAAPGGWNTTVNQMKR